MILISQVQTPKTQYRSPAHLIIPAAGLGRRMRSVDPKLPKELLPLGQGRVIDYAIEEAIAAGIPNVIIIINRYKEAIRQYVNKNYGESEAIRVKFLYQKESLGECDAIYYARKDVGDDAFAVIYPDDIYLPSPGALKTLVPVFRKYKKDTIALIEINIEKAKSISNSGRVDLENIHNGIYKIKRFLPKSGGTFMLRYEKELKACGIYIAGPHFFEYIQKVRPAITGGEFTDGPVLSAILNERGFIGCKLKGHVFDAGNPDGYRACLNCISPDVS